MDRRRRRGIGRNEILIGVAAVAVLLLVSLPFLLGSSKESRLEEIRAHVEEIRQAELAYRDAFGEFASADAAPRPLHAVDETPVPWQPSSGFRTISWAPENGEEVLGSYQVTLTDGGFKVVGAADVDGDGERAVFEATHEEEAHLVSEDGVY